MPGFSLAARNIPLHGGYEVIVVGGGPAGCAAAIASSREGRKTLLVEASGSLGGMGAGGLVPAWCPFSDQERIVYAGIAQAVMEKVKAGMRHVPKGMTDWVPIDAERLKAVYDEMVAGSGAEVLFFTMLSGVETDGQGKVTALLLANKSGLSAYAAKVYIDCTGDGDLSVWAGAQFERGDGEGKTQPGSLCFTLSGVDSYAFAHGPYLHPDNPQSPVYSIVRCGKYPLIRDVHLCASLVGPDTVGFNAGHIFGADSTDPEGTSANMMLGRRIARQFRDGLAEFFPEAFANSYLCQTGALLGVRETRRIVCDYRLTLQDFVARRSFPDEICRNCYFVDVHLSAEEAEKLRSGEISYPETVGGILRYGKGESHGVPYRSLIPQKLKNVLLAGRCLGSDHRVNGSLRVMPVCLAMGEAAGCAAAMAADSGDPRAVDPQRLRLLLREHGAYLP